MTLSHIRYRLLVAVVLGFPSGYGFAALLATATEASDFLGDLLVVDGLLLTVLLAGLTILVPAPLFTTVVLGDRPAARLLVNGFTTAFALRS